MADPKYRTPEYRAAAARYKRDQQAGRWLTCHQPTCLKPTRDIAPTDPIDVAHDESGTVVLGPAHRHCNRSDGGKRRHQPERRRWIL